MDYTGKVITKNPVTPTQVSASGVWTLDEALQAQKGNNWPVPGVYNPISRSLRFNNDDAAYLDRTPTIQGNLRTWTWSGWIKLSTLSVNNPIFAVSFNGSNFVMFRYNTSNKLEFYTITGGTDYSEETVAVYRDPSAWYHVVLSLDTTQATAGNRVRIYINNVQQTTTQTYGQVPQNYDSWVNTLYSHNIGRNTDTTTQRFNGYMTEINFVDGQALTPSDFGLADPATGVWVPKKYTGTYGTNGFYLNFKDNSNTTTIGYDYSGNGNNWNTNNFSVTAGAGNDSLTDVPTLWLGYSTGGDTGGVVRGNYCTLNPLNNPGGSTFANGNLDVTTASSTAGRAVGTIGVSSGKWYWEITPTSVAGLSLIGIAAASRVSSGGVGDFSDEYAYQNNGNKYSNGVGAAYGASYVANDVIGVALDLDAGTLVFYKNNSSQGTAYSSISGTFVPAMSDGQNANSSAFVCNFGQRPFAYTPPAGYRSLCTTNLPTPAIGTSSTTLADDYFNTVLYNGTGATLGVTGVGFQPDFVWIKSRSAATDHALYDVVRGDKNQLESNTATAETNETTGLTQFNADGFTVGSLAQVNTNSATYVSWNWKAGGNGVTNTAGTITSTVSASTTAGFSVVTYTGNNTLAQSVGHGCKVNNVATAPSMIIVKSRSNVTNWPVWHSAISINSTLLLDATNAEITGLTGIWGSALPTSTTFGLNRLNTDNNQSGQPYVAYCFAEVPGYSAFGSYTGNGSADGTFVYLGFRPEWIMVKPYSTTGSWLIHDAARDPYNVSNLELQANANSAEYNTNTAGAGDRFDLLSNGFKNRSSNGGANGSGTTYIYAAFAESPFKYANAR